MLYDAGLIGKGPVLPLRLHEPLAQVYKHTTAQGMRFDAVRAMQRPVPRPRVRAQAPTPVSIQAPNPVSIQAPNPVSIQANPSAPSYLSLNDIYDINILRTYNCPYCQEGGLDDLDLRDHCNEHHINDRRQVLFSEKRIGFEFLILGFTEVDIDDGKDWDIFDINEEAGLDLEEGDIVIKKGDSKNSILGSEYRWPTTVPYYLEDSLEINAKGVVLKAFEQYHLKTCINFKPWSGEPNYISVFKGSGCFSSVGNRHVGKQRLSIGNNCDRLATVEHEFLHALGFWHEQSRADRNDYVNIMWDQIEAGKEHNFNNYDDTVSSALGFPYDYTSVMHYSKTAFNKDSKPTIVTKIPEFMDIIGQRMEFSYSDVRKLNRLYNCTTTSTFMDSCSFEQPNICGMIQGEDAKAKWVRVKSVDGGANTDYTNMGQCNGIGFFMHFSTATGNPGDNAYLESRLFYPKRGRQCLQFYMYNSGSADDQLNIWVHEYTKENPKAALRLIQTFRGGLRNSWELHHVTLDASQKFRVVFEGVKGMRTSQGGLSLDDVNLSETQCPHHTWHIRNFTSLLATTPVGSKIYSPTFLSPDGYSFQIGLYINGKSGSSNNMGMYLHLTSGPNDSQLQWPCPWRQATIALMDQHPNIQQRMDNQRMITTDPSKTSTDSLGNIEYFWDDPQKVGSLVKNPDGTFYHRGPGTGTSSFITHSRLKSRDFIKGSDVIFLLSLEDVTGLLETQPVPQAAGYIEGKSSLPSLSAVNTTSAVVFAFVGLLTLLLVLASVVYGVRRLQRSGETDERGNVPETVNGCK
ncbi:meprin A subunit beta precursor [Silurus asotus]|uniref:Metalloendopeptidase n=1 Tax=Silurus asotus TaxID=30991 RepID=A0AAD5APA8_SILAS|nr:meprin A subunit beta precursor [Silurus asotus]